MDNRENMNMALNDNELESVAGGASKYELVGCKCKYCGWEHYLTVIIGEPFEIHGQCEDCERDYVFTRADINW